MLSQVSILSSSFECAREIYFECARGRENEDGDFVCDGNVFRHVGEEGGDKRKMRSLNARFYVSNKFILNSSNLTFKLEQWQVEVESTKRKVKILKSETIFLVF